MIGIILYLTLSIIALLWLSKEVNVKLDWVTAALALCVAPIVVAYYGLLEMVDDTVCWYKEGTKSINKQS